RQHIFNPGGPASAPPPAPLRAPPLPNLELPDDRREPPPPRRDDRWRDRDQDDDRDRRDRERDRGRDRDDHDRPRRRRDYDDYDPGRGYWSGRADSAHTLGLLSCILCWMPLIGFILGIIAYSNATSELARMDDDRAGSPSTRDRFHSAKNMGLTGLILSVVLFVSCCLLQFTVGVFAPRRW
ncbi:MAG: hypothetical protein K2W96_14810, partial [Gemmataceae bacterium]|nr:hypothetical protein [Gemmataceae bacterium]